ncbi:MAG: hypothetical protein Kow009_03760 [Spirochaetales bacterium]
MNRRVVLEGIGFSLLSILLYQFQTTILIFVIPLVVLYRRQGYNVGMLGTLGIFLGILLVKIVRGKSAGLDLGSGLFTLDLMYPFIFLLGVALMEGPFLSRFPPYGRIAWVTVLAGVLGIPLIRYVLLDPSFHAYLQAQVDAMLQAVVEGKTDVDLGTMGTIRSGEVVRLSKSLFANTYTLGYFFTFLLNWVVGSRIGLRSIGMYLEGSVLGEVHLPVKLVWGFLLGWFGVLLTLIRPLGWIGILCWNVALVSTALYGLQGIDILRYYLKRLERWRLLVLFTILFFLFIPGLNLLVMVGVPLLGVSEIWIHYRRTVEERREE